MPSTATIAAMPIAMPSADSAARRRRVRRPSDPVRRTSAAACMPARRCRTRRGRRAARRGAAARAARSRSWVISDDRRAVGVQLAQQRDDPGAGAAVEVAGRLVGEHDRRAGRPARGRSPRAGARRRRAATGGARRRWPRPTRSSASRARRRRSPRPRPRRAGRWRRCRARSSRRAGRTAGTRSRSAPRAQRRELAVAHARPRRARRRARRRRRPLERAHHVQQRRLAGARRADDRDQLARRSTVSATPRSASTPPPGLAHVDQLSAGVIARVTTGRPARRSPVTAT